MVQQEKNLELWEIFVLYAFFIHSLSRHYWYLHPVRNQMLNQIAVEEPCPKLLRVLVIISVVTGDAGVLMGDEKSDQQRTEPSGVWWQIQLPGKHHGYSLDTT